MGLSLSFVVCFEGVRSSSRPKIREPKVDFPPPGFAMTSTLAAQRTPSAAEARLQSSSLFLQPHLIFMISDLWCMTFNITRSC